MTTIFPDPLISVSEAVRGKATGSCGALSLSYSRLPTDPLFYANLTLENIVVGSRYRVTRHDNGAELAMGVAAATTEVIPGIPCFANPMLVDITVRKASGSPNYKVFDTAAYIERAGGSAYILQQLDE